MHYKGWLEIRTRNRVFSIAERSGQQQKEQGCVKTTYDSLQWKKGCCSCLGLISTNLINSLLSHVNTKVG